MKYTGIFFCALLIGCKPAADKKILEEFKKVNESIDEKNKALSESNTYTQNYLRILSAATTHPKQALFARQVYEAADSAIQYINQIEDLLRKDKTGEDVTIATNLLARGPQGDTLKEKLWFVYQYSLACPLSTKTIYTMDSTLKEIRGIPVSLNWAGAYFEQTASATAIILLEDIRNDILYATGIVMADMAAQVKK